MPTVPNPDLPFNESAVTIIMQPVDALHVTRDEELAVRQWGADA